MSHSATSVADNYLPATACFSVHARAEPGVMPRVLELFAKRGLVPSFWQSSTSGARSVAADDRHPDARARPRHHRLHGSLPATDRLCRGRVDLAEATPPADRSIAPDVVPRPHQLMQQLRSGARRAADRRERSGRAVAPRQCRGAATVSRRLRRRGGQGGAGGTRRCRGGKPRGRCGGRRARRRGPGPEMAQRDLRRRSALGRATRLSPRPGGRPVLRDARLRRASQRLSPAGRHSYACGSADGPRTSRWRRTSSTTSSPAGSATVTGSRRPC